MLSATQKNKIVNSYSNVLCNILSNVDSSVVVISKLKEQFCDNDLLNKLIIKPSKVKDYKVFIKDCLKNVDKKNDLEKFLIFVLERRYGYLLEEILLSAEKKIDKKMKIVNMVVFSNNELSGDVKNKIADVLKQQGIESGVEYKINNLLKDDEIEFCANSKICVLSIENLVNKMLEINSL